MTATAMSSVTAVSRHTMAGATVTSVANWGSGITHSEQSSHTPRDGTTDAFGNVAYAPRHARNHIANTSHAFANA